MGVWISSSRVAEWLPQRTSLGARYEWAWRSQIPYTNNEGENNVHKWSYPILSPHTPSLFFSLMLVFTIRCRHEAGKWLLVAKADRLVSWKSVTKLTLFRRTITSSALQEAGHRSWVLHCFCNSMRWAKLSFWHCLTQDYFGATQLPHSVQDTKWLWVSWNYLLPSSSNNKSIWVLFSKKATYRHEELARDAGK